MLTKCLISLYKFFKSAWMYKIFKQILKGFVLWEFLDLFRRVRVYNTHEFILKSSSFLCCEMVFDMRCRNHHPNEKGEIIKINVVSSSSIFQLTTFHKVGMGKLRNKSVEWFIFHFLPIWLKVIWLVKKFEVVPF